MAEIKNSVIFIRGVMWNGKPIDAVPVGYRFSKDRHGKIIGFVDFTLNPTPFLDVNDGLLTLILIKMYGEGTEETKRVKPTRLLEFMSNKSLRIFRQFFEG